MLTKLTHPLDDHDLWVDLSEIIVMERKHKPKTTLVTLDGDRPEVTGVVLRAGKTFSCKETPDEIIVLMKG